MSKCRFKSVNCEIIVLNFHSFNTYLLGIYNAPHLNSISEESSLLEGGGAALFGTRPCEMFLSGLVHNFEQISQVTIVTPLFCWQVAT